MGARKKGKGIDWGQKLTSRKFWLALSGVMAATAGLLAGQLDWMGFVMALSAAIASYQVGEGLSDAGRGARQEP